MAWIKEPITRVYSTLIRSVGLPGSNVEELESHPNESALALSVSTIGFWGIFFFLIVHLIPLSTVTFQLQIRIIVIASCAMLITGVVLVNSISKRNWSVMEKTPLIVGYIWIALIVSVCHFHWIFKLTYLSALIGIFAVRFMPKVVQLRTRKSNWHLPFSFLIYFFPALLSFSFLSITTTFTYDVCALSAIYFLMPYAFMRSEIWNLCRVTAARANNSPTDQSVAKATVWTSLLFWQIIVFLGRYGPGRSIGGGSVYDSDIKSEAKRKLKIDRMRDRM